MKCVESVCSMKRLSDKGISTGMNGENEKLECDYQNANTDYQLWLKTKHDHICERYKSAKTKQREWRK